MSDLESNGIIITITFSTSASEQVRAARAVFRHSWAWWLSMGAFVILPLLLGSWVAVSRGWRDGQAAGMLLLAIGQAVFWTIGIQWITVLAARRGVADASGPYTWSISQEGCVLTTPKAETRLQWAAIVRVRETPQMFLLYLGRNMAHFIPKRAISEGQLAALRAILNR